MQRHILAFLIFLCVTPQIHAKVWDITCFHGLSQPRFSTFSLHINAGDTVDFLLDPACSVIEVSAASYNAGVAVWNGGFQTPAGGGMVVPAPAPGYPYTILYFVCPQHFPSGMERGMLYVYQPSINVTALQPLASCGGDSITIAFSAYGVYGTANLFLLQLSDESGGFASPTELAVVPGTTYYQPGQIPSPVGGYVFDTVKVLLRSTIPPGSGYRVRVVSAMHAITGTASPQTLGILSRPAPAPQALGPTEFCEGGSVTLAVTPTTGNSYAWYRDDTPVAGASQPQYTATLHGNYAVAESNGNCTVLSDPVAVIVHAADPSRLEWTGAVNDGWSTIGNWSEPCAVPGPGDTVIIGTGSAPPAFVPASQLGVLRLDHPAGLILQGELQISSRLILNGGRIHLGNADLVLLSSATIAGGDAASFIVTDGAGCLRQHGLGTWSRSGDVLFPVGSAAGSYTPVTLANSGTADAFGVRVVNEVFEQGSSGPALQDRVVARTWFIDEGTAGGSNATLRFEWSAVDETFAFDRAACFVSHYDGSGWNRLQDPAAATGGGPWQRGVSGVTDFTLFAVGSSGSYIPVEYRSFTASVQDGSVLLRWETESETQNRGFAVERRRTLHAPWTVLVFVDSRGGEERGASYLHPDLPPLPGAWEYRLRQVDLDGTESFSPIVRAVIPESALPYYTTAAAIDGLWPNPLQLGRSTELSVRCHATAGGPVSLTLHDLLGRCVAELYRGDAESGTPVTVRRFLDRAGVGAALTPGAYVLRFTTTAGVAQRVLVVD